jgi:hypothetical protein
MFLWVVDFLSLSLSPTYHPPPYTHTHSCYSPKSWERELVEQEEEKTSRLIMTLYVQGREGSVAF